MSENTDRQKTIETLGDIASDVKTAMLTTVAKDGSLHSRPMLTASPTFDSEIYFITESDDEKCAEIRGEKNVNITYSCPERDRYASISGTAVQIVDAAKLETLWTPEFENWFPGGQGDPSLCLLMVRVERAEYWDEETSSLGRVIEFVKSFVTGSTPDGGEHGQITWHDTPTGVGM